MQDEKMLLDLSTDKYVASIKIDNEKYGLIVIDQLGIVHRERVSKLGKSLAGANIKTAKDEEKHDSVLLEILCLIVPDASRSLLGKLSILKKIDVVNAYMEVSGLVKKKVTQLKPGPRAQKKKRKK